MPGAPKLRECASQTLTSCTLVKQQLGNVRLLSDFLAGSVQRERYMNVNGRRSLLELTEIIYERVYRALTMTEQPCHAPLPDEEA